MPEITAAFFDALHDRRVPGDIKHQPVAGTRDLIPMWIADMDFRCAPAVSEALRKHADYGIFGYTEPDDEYDGAVVDWYARRMHWRIDPASVLKMPSVMFAIGCAIRALSEAGDAVLICQPVYFPFERIIAANGRRPVISRLRESEGRYEMDFADMEAKIRAEKIRLFLLCSPHNPVGRVWSGAELKELVRLCEKYDVFIVSDEIHSDFVHSGRHLPLAALAPQLAERLITCTSPTKTFNLAGLQAANIIVDDAGLRRKLRAAAAAVGGGELNSMAIAATKAAYRQGEPWLEALLPYLRGNIEIIKQLCRDSGGRLKLTEPEGTYLLWLDCRALGLTDSQLNELLLYRAGVRLHSGPTFGEGGSGFVRMNIACPRSIVSEAARRILNSLA